ncbi:MAG: hypothetical protein AMS24_01450 [Chlamydiae bacterium SM23_39]|nr:MAG: hypothetical protein AMS24_01450 [Chlamydiae bacterium SM23_39]
MKKLDVVVMSILIFAGINWGLWGLFEFNLVYYIFGKEWIDKLLYVLFGAAGVYYLTGFRIIAERWAQRRK